jgi:GTPase SAR1 family protein
LLPLHRRNIEAIGNETLRLLTYTDQILCKHISTPDLVRDADPDQARQLDATKVATWRRVIQNEIEKVENFEAVVAVVGAAKAGKSTTINAIVGADILPNRSDPMTTFPTLVRHVPHAVEPTLTFPLSKEFVQLAQEIKTLLSTLERDQPLNILFRDHIERTAVEWVQSGIFDSIDGQYRGRKDVSDFLKRINDLCRLATSRIVRMELPDPEKAGHTRLPVIEIQFHHVSADKSALGRLTILDLPGPNEAGQGQRLRTVVREQLRRASAVILVCDGTQPKVEAAVELQDMVGEFLAGLQDRLFIFINKIDQLDNGDEKDRIRENYSQQILNGMIQPGRIFPIAARYAFLANWAQREIATHHQLPNPSVNPTTGDFGVRALGIRWDKKINDIEEVQQSASALWLDSRFADPLENVIQTAAGNAAVISLKSASTKLLECNNAMDSFLGLRQSVATLDVQTINEQLKGLESDVRAILSAREAIEPEMAGLIDVFKRGMEELSELATKRVEGVLEYYFEKGRVEEREALRKKKRAPRRTVAALTRKGLIKLGDLITSMIDRFNDSLDNSEPLVSESENIGPLIGVRTFRGAFHKAEADELVRKINADIGEIFVKAGLRTKSTIEEASRALADRVIDEVNAQLSEILVRAKERLERAFDISFAPPSVDLQGSSSLKVDIRKGSVTSALEHHTRHIEREGEWSSVQRWFGDLFGKWWGYDEITESSEVSNVDLAALRDRAIRQLGGFEVAVGQDVKRFVESELRPSVETYFGGLISYLEEFRGDLLDVLQDTKLEAVRLDALQQRINELRDEVGSLIMDARSLAEGLEAL